MEFAILEALVTGGPVAILAVIIFWMYRKDRKDTEGRIHDVHSAHSERLKNLLEKDQKTREDNTKALAELLTWLRAKNGGK